MRVVVLGAGGQLGRSLSRRLPGATQLGRGELDISDRRAVAALDWSRFDTVINAAAYTAVDRAETPDGRPAAWLVNAVGVANLARAASLNGMTLVHVSTEYVFDGRATGPMPESCPVAPLGVYGASKAAGELAAACCPSHYIIRSSWMVGDGSNFVRTMLNLGERAVPPTVVNDQFGRPTFSDDLASAIVELISSRPESGIYHLTNGGDRVCWAGLARAVFTLAGHSAARVIEISTADYVAGRPHCAPRPRNSVLDLRKAAEAGIRLPPWRDTLAGYVDKELARR